MNDDQNQSTPQSSSNGGCKSTPSCRCLGIGVWILGCAIVLAAIFFAGKQLFTPKEAAVLPKDMANSAIVTAYSSKDTDLSAKYTAKAYFRVAYQPESLVFSSGQQPDLTEFNIFKNTQKHLMKSRYVLAAALRKPEQSPISRLPILKDQ